MPSSIFVYHRSIINCSNELQACYEFVAVVGPVFESQRFRAGVFVPTQPRSRPSNDIPRLGARQRHAVPKVIAEEDDVLLRLDRNMRETGRGPQQLLVSRVDGVRPECLPRRRNTPDRIQRVASLLWRIRLHPNRFQ
jgi:hypothetical protein